MMLMGRRTIRVNWLFFVGAAIVAVSGLLAALIPALAYVTVRTYFQNVSPTPFPAGVIYPLFDLSIHAATAKYLLCGFAGIIGLSSIQKHTRPYTALVSVILASIGLFLPIERVLMGIPEAHFIDVQWIGSLLVLVGLSLMFLGLVENKTVTQRITILSVPILLGAYLIYPLLIAINYLPWTVFGTYGFVYFSVLLIALLGHLLMIWGTYKVVKSGLKN
jgi:hypothetical protein